MTFLTPLCNESTHSALLRAQNTTLLSKVRQRFFQILWPSKKPQTLIFSSKFVNECTKSRVSTFNIPVIQPGRIFKENDCTTVYPCRHPAIITWYRNSYLFVLLKIPARQLLCFYVSLFSSSTIVIEHFMIIGRLSFINDH